MMSTGTLKNMMALNMWQNVTGLGVNYDSSCNGYNFIN